MQPSIINIKGLINQSPSKINIDNSSIYLKPSLKSNVQNIEKIDVLSPDKSNNLVQLG